MVNQVAGQGEGCLSCRGDVWTNPLDERMNEEKSLLLLNEMIVFVDEMELCFIPSEFRAMGTLICIRALFILATDHHKNRFNRWMKRRREWNSVKWRPLGRNEFGPSNCPESSSVSIYTRVCVFFSFSAQASAGSGRLINLKELFVFRKKSFLFGNCKLTTCVRFGNKFRWT